MTTDQTTLIRNAMLFERETPTYGLRRLIFNAADLVIFDSA